MTLLGHSVFVYMIWGCFDWFISKFTLSLGQDLNAPMQYVAISSIFISHGIGPAEHSDIGSSMHASSTRASSTRATGVILR